MNLTRRAPQLGIAACLAVLVVIIAPYVLLPQSAGTGLALYYDAGFFGPQLVGVFAAVGIVVLGAGLGERSDPVTVAGAALVIGLFMTLMSVEWVVAVSPEDITGITTQDWLAYHRWLVLACSALSAVAAGLYARALGVL
ncbi:hypothetical protein HAPAU_24130 [Halalkalicoccus paucihalophilus]|uniref:DUF4149 domain-containing protein n=1 Tax=Halalkalicoccus paucihalophilus TaxID=1008153 RepID=A0A151ADK4_9EURY|nr:hypothetical protein [Halalkalicoccus paucihalophilus]KYH25735.1 hypothetical protein HAPAU_24130 [Halalkalicoccus paucihalophilus]